MLSSHRRLPLQGALTVEYALPTRTAGTSLTPSAAAAAVAASSCSPTERSAAPFRTAEGCISQAAAAISTLSVSSSGRPPANAWRNAACANATTFPIDFAYVATRIAKRAVERERVGPAQLLQAELAGAPLHLQAEDVLVVAAAKRLEGLRARQLARQHRLPLDTRSGIVCRTRSAAK